MFDPCFADVLQTKNDAPKADAPAPPPLPNQTPTTEVPTRPETVEANAAQAATPTDSAAAPGSARSDQGITTVRLSAAFRTCCQKSIPQERAVQLTLAVLTELHEVRPKHQHNPTANAVQQLLASGTLNNCAVRRVDLLRTAGATASADIV